MTSQDVATTRRAAINEWDAGFQRLVKQTVLRPRNREATAAELALLAEHAVRTGLDPMSGQVYGVYRYDKRVGGEVMTIQVGIDGLRAVAERTGTYLGQSGPFWCGEDGEWHETWFSTDPPKAAKVVVRKAIAGMVAETPAVAHWKEYAVTGSGGHMWTEKPALMLAKCAEGLALRKAFPQDLSGLYTDDEMGRAEAGVTSSSPAAIPSSSPAEINVEDCGWEPSDAPPEPEVVDGEAVSEHQSADIQIVLTEAAKGLTFREIKLALDSVDLPTPPENTPDVFARVPPDRVKDLLRALGEIQEVKSSA